MFYFDLLEQFYKNNIRYLIVGGLAVNLYGVPRVTQDLDIVIAIGTENILRMNGILKELGYVPRLPVNPDEMADSETVKQWTEERNLKAFSFYHKKENYKVLDIILVHPLDFNKAFSHKTVKSAGGIDINLVSLDDLITMKAASGRGQDLSDIAMLEKVRKYLEENNG
jgi:hypothetical protein